MSIIRFIFSGDTKQLDDAAKSAKATLGELGKEARRGVTDFTKWSAAAAAAGAAVGAYLVKNSLEAIDTQAKLARSLGSTTQGLEVLTRAGERSGVALSGIEQATKDLTRRLSQAAGGAGPAVDALERLKLTADALAQLPLDQRIATINRAIDEFIPAAERAAVAGQLFGEEGSLAVRRLDPETIRQAAQDVRDFGTAVSEVDAAKIEMANDAMGRIGMVVDGLVNKFTVELAPVLTALSKQFTDVARESDLLGEGGSRAFDGLIRGAAFAMDAVEGLRRTFELAGQGIAVFMLTAQRNMMAVATAIVEGPINRLNALIDLVNKLPGEKFDLPKIEMPQFAVEMREQVELSHAAVQEGWAAINETLSEPLPGGQFLKFVEEARAAGQEAAEALAAAQSGAPGEDGPDAAAAPDDATRDNAQKRLEALRKAYQTELQDLQAKFGEEQEILAEAQELKLISEEEFKARMLEIEQGYQDSVTDIEKRGAEARKRVQEAENRQRFQAAGKALGDLSTLMNSESRKMFEVGKAAAIAQTVLSTYEGAQKAFSSLAGIPIVGPALGAAAAGAAIAAGVARVQAIRSQSFGGGSAPAVSNTQAVNAASTPVGGPSGGDGGGGGTYTLVGLDPAKMYNGRDIISVINQAIDDGAKLRIGTT